MTEEQQAILAAFADGSRQLRELAAIVPAEQIDTPGADGGWSARQILAHVADTELILAVRFRQFIAENEPQLLAFHPDGWSEALDYQHAPHEEMIALAMVVRRNSAALLARADAGIWQRTALHATRGRLDLAALLQMGINHLRDHGNQLRTLTGAAA